MVMAAAVMVVVIGGSGVGVVLLGERSWDDCLHIVSGGWRVVRAGRALTCSASNLDTGRGPRPETASVAARSKVIN